MRRRNFLEAILATVVPARVGNVAAGVQPGNDPAHEEHGLTTSLSASRKNLDWLIPQPQELEALNRSRSLARRGKAHAAIVVGRNAQPLEQLVAGELRSDWVQMGADLEVVREEGIETLAPGIETLIVLGTADSSPLISPHARKFSNLTGLGPEGYVIQPVELNGREGVFGLGNTPEGVKNAAMTLSQMAVEEDNQVSLLLARIADYPDISWRGVNKMLDYLFPDRLPSKGYVEGITNFHDLLDEMMRVKFNTLIVHAANITWRVQRETTASWELSAGSYKGPQYWTPKIQEIIEYAHARGIRVALLLYHTLSGKGKIMATGKDICLSDKSNHELLMDEFRTYIDAFPDLDAFVIHTSEFERCTCEMCRPTPPWKEFIEYFNSYHQILRERKQETIMAYVALAEYYAWISKEHKDVLPSDARNFFWSDFFTYRSSPGKWEPRCDMGRTSFLLPVSETLEAQQDWFDDLPGRAWYWLYINDYMDLEFPSPGFFKSRAMASKVKNVESVQGEFGYQRGAALNTLALTAFTWNGQDDEERLRKAALARLYGIENLRLMLPITVAYEKLIQDFVAMIGMVDANWRSPNSWWLDDELGRVVGECVELTTRLGGVRTSSPQVAERLRGFQDDLAILKEEALIRQKLREAYLNYEVYAPQVYGISGTGTAENTRRSLRRAKEALELHRALVQMREERATPLRPVKAHHEVLQKLLSSLENAMQALESNQAPIRPDWDSVERSFWTRTFTW